MKKLIAILGMVMVITISAIGVVILIGYNHVENETVDEDSIIAAVVEKGYVDYANDTNKFSKQIAYAKLSINAEGCNDNPWYNFDCYDQDGNYIGWGGMHRDYLYEVIANYL